jgi:hypothetical protein
MSRPVLMRRFVKEMLLNLPVTLLVVWSKLLIVISEGKVMGPIPQLRNKKGKVAGESRRILKLQ